MITPEQAAKLCDRNFGIGGDGVRLIWQRQQQQQQSLFGLLGQPMSAIPSLHACAGGRTYWYISCRKLAGTQLLGFW
jgi:hypothetical protein